MSAIKEYALALEKQQAVAATTEPDCAFRLGMLAAASIVLDTRSVYTQRFDEGGSAAWRALADAFSAIDDAYGYLRAVAHGEPANGPERQHRMCHSPLQPPGRIPLKNKRFSKKDASK